MRITLVGDQFAQVLATFNVSAFRLEQQPMYTVTYERDTFDKFLAGTPEPPTECEALRRWFDQIRTLTGRNKSVGRARIFDDPPTDYQRWEQWIEPWNRDAGETFHHFTRDEAHRVGLLPAAGPRDWWLIDDQLLMIMFHDDVGTRIHTELTNDEEPVRRARLVRDLAVRAAQRTIAT